MKDYIVLISVDHNNSRKVCEQIENLQYNSMTGLIKDLHTKLGDWEDSVIILSISDFMNDVNDQLLDVLSEYFMTYVKVDKINLVD